MKQIAQNYKSGELAVLDVPAPTCRPGGVLVRSLFSLISTGTEMMKVTEASMSMVGMARARPDQVKKVLDQVQQQGACHHLQEGDEQARLLHPARLLAVRRRHRGRRGAPRSSRSASSSRARATSRRCTPSTTGCRSTCARPSPTASLPEHAAFATVASIAMHGVRRAEVQLGETAVVIGLGLIGQLVVRLLVAAGVQAVGIDPVEARCRLAEKAGAALAGRPTTWTRVVAELATITSGRGADHVFLAAGGNTQRPGRGGGEARPGPRPGRRHRQDEARPAVERLLREGARRPVLPVLRAGPVRQPLRARRHRLPGRVRPLDREAEPGVLPRPARPQLA